MPFVSEPHIAALSLAAVDKLVAGHIPLGEHPETRDVLLVPEGERYSGTYVSGVQNSGKSSLFANMILHDAEVGNAVIVIDPHGDLAMHCLARLPAFAVCKAHLLNMEDEEHPFGVNPFGGYDTSTGLKLARAVDMCMHIFENVWPTVLSQQYLPKFLRAAVLVLLANPRMTLVDMRHFLLDDRFRAQLLKQVTDPMVLDFWRSEYDELSDGERSKRVAPLLGRLDILFVGRSIVRNILGQETTINFRTAIENKELIFITLPTQSLTLDARLIGTALMAQIHAAVFSFADLPADKRPGVSIYIDEVQNFVTQDIAELFTQGRKFGTRLVTASQYRGQLPEYLRQATMTARTKICFRQTPDDAHDMAHQFRSKYAEVRPEDIDEHPLKYLLTYPINDYHVRLFVDRYLRVLQSMRRGNMVHITLPPSALTAMRTSRMQTYRVFDPTLQLDQLLYEVMITGDPWLPIPWEIVEGYSGCGHTFYREWQRVLDKEWWLGQDITFPPELVVERPDGSQYWTRRPEGQREELYNFIFVLRQTMLYVAEHPLGEATALTTTEIAQMLTELPHRAAFVRTGDDVGVIYTIDTPPAVPADELQERLATIQSQTREKYCTPKAQIEDRFVKPTKQDTNTSADTPIRRWEEL